MKTVKSGCNQSSITALLVDELSQSQTVGLEDHLEQCENCRFELVAQAASPETWRVAHDYLRDDEDDWDRLDEFAPSSASPAMPPGIHELIDALDPTDDPRMLGRLGPLEICGVVGAGGMGIVLKAFDPALARFVAAKVLSPRHWHDEPAQERFRREARAAAPIVHESVIEIYGVAEVEWDRRGENVRIPYFTMPYLRGDSLQKRIDRRGLLHTNEVLRIAGQIASGLAAAHRHGLVHRDIKPANILLNDGCERVWVTDFGLVHTDGDKRLTRTGVVAGTPPFMSPEQVRGDLVDHRSDLFSLGSVMYAMCTGRPPFSADTDYELLSQIVAASPIPISEINSEVPDWLAAIIDRLHEADAKNRYQSAEELAGDLEKCLAHTQNPDSHEQPKHITKLAKRYDKKVQTSQTNVQDLRETAAIEVSARQTRTSWLTGLIAAAGLLVVGLLFHGPLAQAPADTKSITVAGDVVDENDRPLAGVTVLAIQKTWPNRRYRQQSLKTETDQQGRFQFADFAGVGDRYAYLVAAVPEGSSMVSHYQFVKDGSQQDPVRLKAVRTKPVTISVRDPDGKPVVGLEVLPSSRTTTDNVEHFTYAMQIDDFAKKTNARGEVTFSSWLPGETGVLTVRMHDKVTEHSIKVSAERSVSVTYTPPEKSKPAGPPVSIRGKVVDINGKALANVRVMAVRKTWPGGRFRQDGLETKTDDEGHFAFDEFAPGKRQYAVLLTVIEEGYAMVSDYRVVEDGSAQEPITLRAEPAEPVTFIFRDANGDLIEGLKVCPNERESGRETPYLHYHLHMKSTYKVTDASGEVKFSAWKAGEKGELFYQRDGRAQQLPFQVGNDRRVELTLP